LKRKVRDRIVYLLTTTH